jgi:hypothetical protein
MDIFLAGTAVNAVAPLVDRNGSALTVTALGYRIVDQNNTEIVPRTNLAGFVSGSATATITVLAINNNIAVGAIREIRNIELFCTVGGNLVMLNKAYVLEPVDPLQIGVNSFQNYAQSQMTAMDIPNTPSWDAATDNDRIAALIDARSHIIQLNFYLLNSNINFGQDNLNYIPQGVYVSNYVTTNGLFIFNGNLGLLDATQYAQLPARLKTALNMAQVAEADHILGGDVLGQKRRDGIMLESIGEVKQMYRAAKPLDLPVSRRALGYLSYFVTFTKKLAR